MTERVGNNTNRMSAAGKFLRHLLDCRRSAMVCRKRAGGNHSDGKTHDLGDRLKRSHCLVEGIYDVIDLVVRQIEVKRQTEVVRDYVIGFGEAFFRLWNDQLGMLIKQRLRMATAIVKLAWQRDTVILFQLLFQLLP